MLGLKDLHYTQEESFISLGHILQMAQRKQWSMRFFNVWASLKYSSSAKVICKWQPPKQFTDVLTDCIGLISLILIVHIWAKISARFFVTKF